MGFNHFWNMLTLGLCLLNALDTKTKQDFLFKNKAFRQSQECPGSTILSLPPSTEGISGLRWMSRDLLLRDHCPGQASWPGPSTYCVWQELGGLLQKKSIESHSPSVQTDKTHLVSSSLSWRERVWCWGRWEFPGSDSPRVKSDDSEWGHWGSLPRGDGSEFIGKWNLESARGTELRAAGATVNWDLKIGVSRCVRGTVVQDVHIAWEVDKSPHGTSVYNKQPWMMRPSSVLQDRVSTSWFSH